MSNVIILGAVVALFVWLYWPHRKGAEPKSVPLSEPSVIKPVATDEEGDVARAKQASKDVQREAEEELERHHREQEATRLKLSRARKYVQETGLAYALPRMWEAVSPWGTWINLPDRWTPPEGFTDITGGTANEKWTQWRYKNHLYRITFRDCQNYFPGDYDSLGAVTLEFDGNVVAVLDCARGIESYDGWRFAGVDALTVGPWMSEFVTMDGVLQRMEAKSMRETIAEIDVERARRITLDD